MTIIWPAWYEIQADDNDHAGAIIAGGKGTADAKFAALNDVGVATTNSPSAMGQTMVMEWAKYH